MVADSTGKLYTPEGYPRAWRALIAAKYSNTNVECIPYIPGETNAQHSFLTKFPPSEVPVFESSSGVSLFEVNAIAYYLGTPELRVGDAITQADITLFTVLYLLFTHVFDGNFRKTCPHVERWYITIANQPQVNSIVGKYSLCQIESKFDAKKFAELHGHQKEDGKVKHKGKQPKAEGNMSKKEKAPKSDDDEDDIPQPKPANSPLAELLPGSFNMDEFKRTISNNDVESVALPYLWEHFDSQHYSIWFCEYKFPEELNMLFMTANLLGGMYQRLEKMLKYGFASCCVLGQDKDNIIRGVWIWRGTGLIFDVDPDLQVDYESYNWRKLDVNSQETKELVRKYFTTRKEIDGKPVASKKVFK